MLCVSVCEPLTWDQSDFCRDERTVPMLQNTFSKILYVSEPAAKRVGEREMGSTVTTLSQVIAPIMHGSLRMLLVSK